MLNHPDVMWRYAEALSRQAELEGRGRHQQATLIAALASPQPIRRRMRLLGFR